MTGIGQLLTYTDDLRMATMQQKLPFPENKRRPEGRRARLAFP
jgi:hypothetical protein